MSILKDYHKHHFFSDSFTYCCILWVYRMCASTFGCRRRGYCQRCNIWEGGSDFDYVLNVWRERRRYLNGTLDNVLKVKLFTCNSISQLAVNSLDISFEFKQIYVSFSWLSSDWVFFDLEQLIFWLFEEINIHFFTKLSSIFIPWHISFFQGVIKRVWETSLNDWSL